LVETFMAIPSERVGIYSGPRGLSTRIGEALEQGFEAGGAAWAEQAEHLAGGNRQADGVDGGRDITLAPALSPGSHRSHGSV
jgi:hypothetical protein